MATVATLLSLAARTQNFDVPGTLEGVSNPFAITEFIGSVVVPAKDAADTNTLVITCTFPVNYVFKIATLNVHYLATSPDQLDDFMDDITPGFIGQGFGNLNQNLAIELVNGEFSHFRTATNDIVRIGRPRGDYQVPIRTGLFPGDNSLSFSWIDDTADSTVAITVFFRLRALQYTIKSFTSYPMFDAVPVIGV